MAIAFGAAATTATFFGTSTPATIDITIPSGTDVVYFIFRCNDANTNPPTSVTFDGNAMTQVDFVDTSGDTFYVYKYISPATGTKTCSATPPSGKFILWASAICFSGDDPNNIDAALVRSTGADPLTTNITTVSPDAWLVGLAVQAEVVTGGSAWVDSSNATVRASNLNVAIGASGLYTRGPIASPGATSLISDYSTGSATAVQNFVFAIKEPITLLDLADAIGVTDSASRSIARTLADSVSTSTAQSLIFVFTQDIADAISVADSIVKNVGKNLAETVTTATSVVRSISRSIADSIGVTDAVATLLTFVRSVSDAILVSDAFSRVWTLAREFTDSISVTDSADVRNLWEDRVKPSTSWSDRTKPSSSWTDRPRPRPTGNDHVV